MNILQVMHQVIKPSNHYFKFTMFFFNIIDSYKEVLISNF